MIYTIVIYLVGYILAYKLWRLSWKSIDVWSWGHVIAGLILSFLSWFLVVVGLFVNLIHGNFNTGIKSKPPHRL